MILKSTLSEGSFMNFDILEREYFLLNFINLKFKSNQSSLLILLFLLNHIVVGNCHLGC